jgi:hypothetical protein
MEVATRRIPTLLNVTGEIAASKVDEERVYLILVPNNAAIATITTMLIDQTLTLGTVLHRRLQVRGPHSFPPPKRLAEEAGTRQFPIVDEEDEADDDGC